MHLDNPGPQKRADHPQNLAVLDALGHQVHQDVMVDVVEASLAAALDAPLVGRRLAGEVVDLGDGILSPTTGPIPVICGRPVPAR
ncbi:hypothetical protein ACIRP7_34645 [Streptomyces sp. NPDC102270]|uniref:hypothetical protein n=1 Tax=Streptomyces sp. NPDC102270 TaxID=3366150 RepID=UPI0038252741